VWARGLMGRLIGAGWAATQHNNSTQNPPFLQSVPPHSNAIHSPSASSVGLARPCAGARLELAAAEKLDCVSGLKSEAGRRRVRRAGIVELCMLRRMEALTGCSGGVTYMMYSLDGGKERAPGLGQTRAFAEPAPLRRPIQALRGAAAQGRVRPCRHWPSLRGH
jgi:hypothetical protein